MKNPAPAPDDLTARDRTRIMWVLLVPLFMTLINVSVVNVALPAVQVGLDASSSSLQWVLSGYTLAFGVLLVASGRAGDVYGRKPLFIAGIVLFAVSSLVCGFAPDTRVLNVSRVVQGLASGLITPQAVGMIQQYFRGPARARAFGTFGATIGVAVAVGPVLGGFLIGALGPDLGWRSTFLLNTPFGLAAVVLAVLWLPRETRRPGRPDMDPVGVAVFAAGVLAVMLPFVEGHRGAWMWALLPAGLFLLVAWVRWEHRYKTRGGQPMVDMDLFHIPSFSFGALMIAVHFLGITSTWIVVAVYAQQGLGRSALEAGLLGLPAAVCAAVVPPFASRAVLRFRHTVVLAGLAVAVAGLLATMLVLHGTGHWGWDYGWLYVSLTMIGLSQGLVLSPNQTLAFSEVPLRFAGAAGGVMQTGQRVGTAIGTAVITAVLFGVLASSGSWETAALWSFGTIVAVVCVAFAIALADGRYHRRSRA